MGGSGNGYGSPPKPNANPNRYRTTPMGNTPDGVPGGTHTPNPVPWTAMGSPQGYGYGGPPGAPESMTNKWKNPADRQTLGGGTPFIPEPGSGLNPNGTNVNQQPQQPATNQPPAYQQVPATNQLPADPWATGINEALRYNAASGYGHIRGYGMPGYQYHAPPNVNTGNNTGQGPSGPSGSPPNPAGTGDVWQAPGTPRRRA